MNLNHKRAIVFVLTTYLFSWVQQYYIITRASINNPIPAFFNMWTPGLVAILLTFIFHENIKDLSFKIPKVKYLALAFFIPLFIAIIVMILLITFEVGEYQLRPELIEKFGGKTQTLLMVLVRAPLTGILLGFISALGEEIGWRGYLLNHLRDYSAIKRHFIIGVVWSVWHFPLILFGDYATSEMPFLSVVLFLISTTASSFLIGYLTEKSRSILVAALIHASHNLWLIGIYPVFVSTTPLTQYFGGESGVFACIIYLGIAAFIFKKYLRKFSFN